MTSARYFVIQVGNRWHVTLEGRTITVLLTRPEAVRTAIIMADLMGAMHHDADVMIETAPGEPLEVIWTYGTDQLPEHLVHAPTAPIEDHGAVRLVQRGEVSA